MCKSVDIFILKCKLISIYLEGNMKPVTAKDLRYKTSLKPLEKVEREFNPVGFAIWKDRKDLKKPVEWVEEKRKERFPR